MGFFTMNDMFGDKEIDEKLLKPRKIDVKSNFIWCDRRKYRIHIKVCKHEQKKLTCYCDNGFEEPDAEKTEQSIHQL